MQKLIDLLKPDRPLLGFDLETTGVSSDARIVEVGLEIYVPGKPVKEYRTLVNPECAIPAGATAVHGITDEMVQDPDVPTFAMLAENLLRGFAQADFIGYNVRFDLRTVSAEFRRVGRPWEYEASRVLDPFRLWQVVEARSLDDASRRWLTDEDRAELGETTDGRASKSHTALYDVKRSTRILGNMLAARGDVLPHDIQKLHELCSPGWYDAEGKLQWREGYLTFSFGKNRGHSLQWVARHDPRYFQFITSKDFSDKVKAVCREAAAGRFPVAPMMEGQDEEQPS